MLKLNRYSTIRGEPKYKPADGFNLQTFYDGLIKPYTLFLALVGTAAFLYQDLPEQLSKARIGDREALLHLILVTLALVTGMRIIQSLFLAKRDYPHLENGFLDIVVFGVVFLVIGGGILNVLKGGDSFLGLLVFTALALVGSLNFFRLLKFRIPRNSDQYDYPIEMRVQVVNTVVCLYCAAVLGFSAWYVYLDGSRTLVCGIAIASTALALIFNMIHSQQLTLLPKFLFTNDPDSPEEFKKLFRQLFWRTAADMTDQAIVECVSKDVGETFRSIKTVRARKRDVARIAEILLQEFRYVFEYVFATQDSKKLRDAVCTLLTVSKGLGAFGYMSFYMLENKRNPVGFIKVDTFDSCWFYRIAESLGLSVEFIRLFGPTNLVGIYRRYKALAAAQLRPIPNEVRLSYIVIYPENRGQGYGSATVRLMINAILQNVTNDIVADRITLAVRETNPAVRLFTRAGFVRSESAGDGVQDPLARIESVGPALMLECTV